MSGSLEETLAALRDEFIFSATTILDEMEGLVRQTLKSGNMTAPHTVPLGEIRQPLMIQAHNLKGSGGSFGFPLITSIAHRFEDFVTELPDYPDAKAVEYLMPFFDAMRDTIDGKVNDTQHSEILKNLPTPRDVRHEEVAKIDLHVLMIVPSRTLTEIIRRSFESAGAAVSSTRFAVEGLGLAIKNKPDVLVVAGVLDGVSGPDIARAVKSMTATQSISPIIVTNQAAMGQEEGLKLPEGVRVIPQNRQLPSAIQSVCEEFTAVSPANNPTRLGVLRK